MYRRVSSPALLQSLEVISHSIACPPSFVLQLHHLGVFPAGRTTYGQVFSNYLFAVLVLGWLFDWHVSSTGVFVMLRAVYKKLFMNFMTDRGGLSAEAGGQVI